MPRTKLRRKGVPKNVERQITRKLKRDHLTEGPTWYRIPTRNVDPPQYSLDAQYQRKIRIRPTFVLTGGDITIAIVAANFAAAFAWIKISRVDIYGHATTEQIQCIARLPSAPLIMSRRFSDTGVEGSRRSHISIELAEQHNNFMPTNSTVAFLTVQIFSEAGIGLPGTLVMDFHCTLMGSKGINSEDGIPNITLPPRSEDFVTIPDVSSLQI